MNEIKNESAVCEICGCTHEELFELEVNHAIRSICADCAEAEGFVQCVDCGEWESGDAAHWVNGHGHICESCYDDNYFTCDNCGEVLSSYDAVRVNPNTRCEEWWCSDCADSRAYRCRDCEDYFTPAFISLTGNDDDCVCDRCVSNGNYVGCGDCGDIIPMDDAFYRDGEWYCDSCDPGEDEDEDVAEGPQPYNYKPYPVFNRRKGEAEDTTLTFGVELEVDRGDSAGELCSELKELNQPIYMKHDGSLGSEGVEIVTHPCSLAYHAYQLRWAAIAKTCISHGYRSHDTTTCGLHIHVGRRQMGANEAERNRTAGNLVLLTNALWDKLVPFTRRNIDRLEQWASKNYLPDMAGMSDDDMTRNALYTVTGGRYQAVNLNNSETVEFRIFRGTLKRESLLAAIQLVSNMTRYAMTHTPKECLTATWSGVLSVQEHKELAAYALERGLA